jgi:uncharacterized linocin/CFP29 family protein
MSRLRRDVAPISERAWKLIDEEASQILRHFLAARKLVDFAEPKGWEHAAEALGGSDEIPPPSEGVTGRLRRVLPLVELRSEFEVTRDQLDAIDSGVRAPDLPQVADAARQIALAEDGAVFHGYKAAGIGGLSSDSPHEPLRITEEYEEYPRTVARAVAKLETTGVGGPYAIALGSRCYTGVIETTEHGGYPVLEHIRMILGGPVVSAPAVDGAIVLSQRGGDFTLVTGGDFVIGYLEHDEHAVRLFLEESMTMLNTGPEAAIALTYPA